MKHDIPLAPDERLDKVNENLFLIQKKDGLTFGTDAYLLAAFVRPMPLANAVELGGGTGIVSLLLAKTGKVANVSALEIQPSFAELINRNAALNRLSEKVCGICADIREVHSADFQKPISLVVANPPYLPQGTGKSNANPQKETARHECFGGIEDFCACAERLLGSGGRFITVWRAERLTDLYAALRKHNLEPKRTVFVHSDLQSPPCMVLTEAVKGASPSLHVLPPLFLYQPEKEAGKGRKMTADAERIYSACQF